MKEENIRAIIDRHLNKWIKAGINKRPVAIEPDMADPAQDPTEEWRTWFPIPSRVTDEEIAAFEEQIGHHLPEDYKTFLQYKHYYDLSIAGNTFASHPVNRWRYFHASMIFDGYPREFLIDKGLLPFADYSDWGLLCFDTNRSRPDTNYPVVLWDHERPYSFQDYAPDFYQLLLKLDQEDKQDH